LDSAESVDRPSFWALSMISSMRAAFVARVAVNAAICC
jgi:hypothetical protein